MDGDFIFIPSIAGEPDKNEWSFIFVPEQRSR